ncbi:MAG: hypothetical protein ACYDEE_18010 [Ignavibacteriaceae bacterium]
MRDPVSSIERNDKLSQLKEDKLKAYRELAYRQVSPEIDPKCETADLFSL